jgi:hypothetical protein
MSHHRRQLHLPPHASAAGADTSVQALNGYLLKTMPVTDLQGTAADSGNMIEAITAIDHIAETQGFTAGDALNGTIGQYANNNDSYLREQAVGVFCAECHNGAYATAAAGASTNLVTGDAGAEAFSGHRIATSISSDWNADGSISSGEVQGGLAVAWAEATNCKSCHDADDDFGNDAFPHSWGQSGVNSAKMWLLSAADAGAAKASVGQASASDFDVERVQLSDGVCLKCHVASGGTDGVGITF